VSLGRSELVGSPDWLPLAPSTSTGGRSSAPAASPAQPDFTSTPNSLAEDQEYRELCEFAVQQGASYVLLNPLSSMGRTSTPGEVTVCPYLVFAARTPQSEHDPAEFIVGNIFTDPDIADRLDAYDFQSRYPMGRNLTCGSCGLSGACGKGCPAAVISAGQRIGAVDAEVCPVAAGNRALLPLAPA
jgi:radical SAM protein with 4Fe4S-binding SPASM domain